MVDLIKHWTALTLGLAATGLLGAFAASHAESARGALGPSIFLAEAPLAAGLATLAAVAGCLVVSIGVGRLTNTLVGLFVLGWGLGVMTMRTNAMREIALADSPNMVLLTIEVLLWAIVSLGLAMAMFRFSGPLKDVFPDEFEESPHPFKSRDARRSALCGLLVLPLVMIIAQSPMKGQVLTAVFFGATGAAMAARLISPHLQPILIFAMPCLAGVIGHIWGMISLSRMNMTLAEAFVQHSIPTMSLPMPLDYAAGSIMGVAFGLGWARSFLHHEESEEEGAKVAAA